MPFIHGILLIFFLNLFHGFPSGQKCASRTIEPLDLTGIKKQIGILKRKCIDMGGVSG